MASDRDAHLTCADIAKRGLYRGDPVSLPGESLYLAVLDDVHAQCRCGACIAPGHGIVSRSAAAALHKSSKNRKTSIVRTIQVRYMAGDFRT